jgi:predicted AAA+ superfamily ATPase
MITLGQLLHPRLNTLPRSSFFLLGPRGSGKTTWLRQALPHAHFISLLNEERYQEYLVRAGTFRQELQRLRPGSWVVVDEIQRLPNLLNEVHAAIEEGGFTFALCGFSARKLRRKGVNMLAGRALMRVMYPFATRLRVKKPRRSKLYFVDGGLPRALKRQLTYP